ncbi:MAG: tRNA (adenosine(37)-N6)-threonylcarbamoyltransferase complex ATPase subunit type 1 TsaE [Chlorobi bacterium]|nr:tRNA (adenosine(37)-N6)-threonylcarbamoyltransferase complex ATPase subunit type 1 TsaE [Chlorobiota bacterium]
MESEVYSSTSEEDTHRIGTQLASRLEKGDIVTLSGELGAGKTEFVRGICRYFHVADIVTSPTFSIINVYEGKMPSGEPLRIVHIDLYRLKNKQELRTIGLDEWLALPDAIKVVEWPEKVKESLVRSSYHVSIRTFPGNDERRQISIEPVQALSSNAVH